MKTSFKLAMWTAAMILLGLIWVNTALFAQETDPADPAEVTGDHPNLRDHFIDRDGDGINDVFQRGLGLRMGRKGRGRGADGTGPGRAGGVRIGVDTDGDGVVDQIMIDTDGDGVGDISLKDHLAQRMELLDRDGDGNPDPLSREELQAHIDAMREWRQSVHEHIDQGLTPFVDEDGDGVPDGRPDPLRRGRGGLNGRTPGAGNQ